jgi:hypothetical protein
MKPEAVTAPERPPYLLAAIVSVGILALYVITIAPTTQFWDTSEYIAAAKVLGIPHPPGNPLFVVMANVWGQIPLVEHYALRINLFSAVCSATASGFLILVAERLLRDIIRNRLARYAAVVAGIIVGATSFTVWNQSVVNEKVYTLSLLAIAVILWLAIVWADREPGAKRDSLLITILYLLALTSTNHTMSLLVAPAIMVLVAATLWKEKANAGEWSKWLVFCSIGVMLVFLPGVLNKGGTQPLRYVFAVVVIGGPIAWAIYTRQMVFASLALFVAVFGLSLYGVLPIRAAHFPPINEGEPTTWHALLAVLDREQYQKGPLLPRQADIVWQYINYFQYFSWQFGRDWEGARRGLAVLFGGIGLFGGLWHWRKDPKRAAAITTLMFTVTLLLVFYLDFKFGYSIRPGEDLLREVRERDYFFVASFLLWGLWMALGFAAILEWGADYFGERLSQNARWFATAPVLIICFIPLMGNWKSASRRGETLPRDVAWDIIQSVEPYGILITAGDNDTFPFWYIQEVEGVRRDVLVANLSLMNTEWHIRQIKRRAVIPFDTANALPIYRGRSWPVPEGSALSPSYGQLDSLPPYYQLGEGQVFQARGIRARLPSVLQRADIVTLQLIQDNLGKRPIYLSRTTGGYGQQMGLTPYLLGQGLVSRIMPQPIEHNDSVIRVSTLGWVDMKRTATLLLDYYHAESVARHRPLGWIDRPSETILTLYALVYATFGQVLASWTPDSGDAPVDSTMMVSDASRANDLAERMFQNTSFARQQPSQ